MANTLLTSITSDPTPQSGQDHRSSGNFSTEGAPAGTSQLLFTISPESNEHFDSITFDVMEDKSVQRDPTVWSGVTNGSKVDYHSSRSYYIANPANAGSNSFTVLVYAVAS